MTRVDWQLFDTFAGRVHLSPHVDADFRPRLELLDDGLRADDPIARRYWRLVEGELRREGTDCEAALDRITATAAFLHHWSEHHAVDRLN